MPCEKCTCDACKQLQKEPFVKGAKKDCKFCEGKGEVHDRFGFFTCLCVRGPGAKTG